MHPPTTLFLATRNTHKTREIQAMLGDGILVRDISAVNELPEVEETGSSFEANAILKAEAISLHVPGWVLADDSGLEIDALAGEPGIYSARYAGPGATDLANLHLVLKKMDQVPFPQRTARFRCVLALAHEGKTVATFDGTVEGKLTEAATGPGGFGYDPIFIPEGYTQTFGELPSTLKNNISHRSRALAAFQRWWQRQNKEAL